MTGPGEPLRVAAVQSAPVFLDRARSTEKVCALIGEAGANGARLIAFGEGAIPAHPIWLHVHPITSPRAIELVTALAREAILVPGPEADALGAAAREADAMVVIGVIERRDPGSTILYSSQLIFEPSGRLAAVRRKLVPAVGERVLLTSGAGDAIRTFDTPWGAVAALLSGENINPLVTWTMRALGARIHVAGWPPHFNKAGAMGEAMSITARSIAYQNSAHVIVARTVSDAASRERITDEDGQRALLASVAAEAGSAVYAPRGGLVAGPLDGDEGILYADLDLGASTWPSLVNRHYDRTDLFTVSVDRSPAASEIDLASGADSAPDGLADARRRVVERYGDRLDAAAVARVAAHVRGSRESARRLEALGPDPDLEASLYPLEDG